MDITQILNDPKTVIIDVREPFEFQSGHIQGATNIPLGAIPTNVMEFQKHDGHIVFYCRSGNRSGQAAAFLRSRGLTNVHNGGSLDEMVMYQNSRAASF